jgi:predicted amidohydrolase YtcJ
VSTIYRNGRVRRQFTTDDIVEAMAVSGSTIVAVGSEAEVSAAAGANADVVDLGGRCVIPGLVDAHTHVAGHALDEKCVELRDTCDPAVTSVAVMLERMAAVAATREPGELVVGIGAMRQNTRLAERRWPSRAELDAAVPDNPAYITFGSHVTCANSRALELGGIDRHTPDPRDGKIEREPGTGEPTGTLLENAKDPVIEDLVSYYSFEQYLDALEAALLRLASTGITTIHDIIARRDQLRAYQVLHDQGRLPVRVMMLIRIFESDFSRESLPDLGLTAGFGDSLLWFGGAKISVDGATSSRSALFKTEVPGQPLDRAIVRVPQDTLDETVARYQRAGIRLAIHTIGDGAVDSALDAFERAGAADSGLRHRLEHFGNWLVTEERLERCRKLGVTPVPNPAFARFLGDDHFELLGGEGSPYGETIYPFRTLADGGFHLAGGSDGPGPYRCGGLRDVGIMAERTSMSGRHFAAGGDLTLRQAFHAQTVSAAWLGYRERTAGVLAAGYDADFLVLDTADVLALSPAELASVGVLRTVVGGRTVYSPGQPAVGARS